MTGEQRRSLYQRIEQATCDITGFSKTERNKHIQAVYLRCLEAKQNPIQERKLARK